MRHVCVDGDGDDVVNGGRDQWKDVRGGRHVKDGMEWDVDAAFFNVRGDDLWDAREIGRQFCYEVVVCRWGGFVWGCGVANDRRKIWMCSGRE